MLQVLLAQAAFQKGPGVHARRGVPLVVDQVAAVAVLAAAAEEMVEADFDACLPGLAVEHLQELLDPLRPLGVEHVLQRLQPLLGLSRVDIGRWHRRDVRTHAVQRDLAGRCLVHCRAISFSHRASSIGRLPAS
jgi:hypothetical protein